VSAPKDVVIVGGARTPMAEWIGGKRGDGKPGGALASVSAIDLGAIAAKGALARARVAPDQVDHVVMGNAMQTSGDALYGARHVALKAGLPITVPALTVNRLCGSGIQAIVNAAQLLLLDEAKIVLAGGMENMSQAPHVLRGLRTGLKLGQQPPLEDSLAVALKDSYCGCLMAQTSDNLAKRYGISREAQDDYAMRSHTAGTERTKSGRFAEEIVPVEIAGKVPVKIDTDEHPRPETTLEGLAKLKTPFRDPGTVTAGNASGVNDGAAAMIIASEAAVKAHGLTPRAKIVGMAAAGVPPRIMGIGPVPSTRKLMERLGLKISDFDVIELNEAFASQGLACMRQLGLPDDAEHVNPNGGAIALGHPLGMSGARIAMTAAHQLQKTGGKRALATMCVGVGQGVSLAIERV